MCLYHIHCKLNCWAVHPTAQYLIFPATFIEPVLRACFSRGESCAHIGCRFLSWLLSWLGGASGSVCGTMADPQTLFGEPWKQSLLRYRYCCICFSVLIFLFCIFIHSFVTCRVDHVYGVLSSLTFVHTYFAFTAKPWDSLFRSRGGPEVLPLTSEVVDLSEFISLNVGL